jgi:hypothetical protein
MLKEALIQQTCSKFCITVDNGTNALKIAQTALGIKYKLEAKEGRLIGGIDVAGLRRATNCKINGAGSMPGTSRNYNRIRVFKLEIHDF